MKSTTAGPGPLDPFDYESTLEACARGERLALRALYDRESRWLLGVALRIVRDRDVAHDVLQDAFLQIWQRATTYQRELGSARGWVYTVVRHRALDEARRAGRETAVGDDIEAYADRHASNHAASALPSVDADSLNRCLEALDERKRECVVYAFVEESSAPTTTVELSVASASGRSFNVARHAMPCHAMPLVRSCSLIARFDEQTPTEQPVNFVTRLARLAST